MESESPARQFVVVQIANGFGYHRDRFVVLPPEGRSLYSLAERLWKLIPMVAAKDSWRLRELRLRTDKLIPESGRVVIQGLRRETIDGSRFFLA